MAPTTGTRRGTQGSGQRRQQTRTARTTPKKSGSSAKATSSTAKATASTRRSSTPPRTTASTRRTSGTAKETSAATRRSNTASGSGRDGRTISVPYVTAQFHTTDVHVPGMSAMPSLSDLGSGLPNLPTRKDLNSAADSARSYLPSRERALFYGGLAAGTVFSLIQWPVAVAIGLATEVVTREQQGHATTD